MKIKSVKKITAEQAKTLTGTSYEFVALRQLRKPLLDAFDIYKSNVYYGVTLETEEEHAEIILWYRDLCDLKSDAINNIPEKIKRYLK